MGNKDEIITIHFLMKSFQLLEFIIFCRPLVDILRASLVALPLIKKVIYLVLKLR